MLDYLSQNWQQNNEDDALQAAMNASDHGVMSGIASGTRVATMRGWQLVEKLEVGDAILTFDNGLRILRSARRVTLWNGIGRCPRQFRPLHVPAGVLGNREAMTVPPRQGLMVESDAAEAATGDPFALLHAEALEGVCGIERFEPAQSVEVYVLQFDEDEIVFTASGSLCVCAGGGDMMERMLLGENGSDYQMLSTDFDGDLIADIRCEIYDTVLSGASRSQNGAQGAPMAQVA